MNRGKITKIATGLAFTLLTTTTASAISWEHKNAGAGDGIIADDSDAQAKFTADRISVGWKYFSGNVVGKVFLDFNQATDDKEGCSSKTRYQRCFCRV